VAGNRIELWGRILGEPELRTTPAGTAVLRITVEGGNDGNLNLVVVMSGEEARRLHSGLQAGSEVRVTGFLKAVRRRLKSGIIETGYEVMADAIGMSGTGPGN